MLIASQAADRRKRMKTKKQMNNKLKIGMLLLIVALVVVPGASATPTYYGILQSIYGGPTTCQADCHDPVTFVFTPYGTAFKAQPNYNDGGVGTHAALVAIGPPLATITVTPATASLTTGGTQPYTANTLDLFGNKINAAVTWTSSKPAVGTINSAGLFTAVGAGTATITATGGGTGSGTKTGTATATVSAPAPVLTTVTISPLNPSVVAGTTKQFSATTLDQNNAPIGATLSWSSSNTSVGTINSAGLFTSVKAGTTTITVTATNGTVTKTASTTATVTAPAPVLATVTISPLNPSVVAGTTKQFSATTLDQNNVPIGATLSWSSSNTSVGTINSAGLFTALTAGTTTITVTATNGTVTKTASTTATVTITAIAPVLTTVTISPLNPSVVAGATKQFSATTLDQNNAPIGATLSWSSSNTSVGTINSAGLFTALTAGTTTINVTATNGTVTKTASTTATVTITAIAPVLTTVTISPLNPSVVAGTTKQFSATTLDQNNAPIGATLSWTSSNTAVGTINSAGLFTAVKAGTTTITVTATNGTVTKTASTIAIVTRHGHQRHRDTEDR
jgi:uncharacterized protein YjdB